MKLEPKGHLGTFIDFIDYKTLWEFTDFGAIMGVMPLPYSKLYEGLATGLYRTVGSSDIPFSLAYMRGADTRLDALKSGRYDFAVTSKLAAYHGIGTGMELDIAVEFGSYTFVDEHAMILQIPAKGTLKMV